MGFLKEKSEQDQISL